MAMLRGRGGTAALVRRQDGAWTLGFWWRLWRGGWGAGRRRVCFKKEGGDPGAGVPRGRRSEITAVTCAEEADRATTRRDFLARVGKLLEGETLG